MGLHRRDASVSFWLFPLLSVSGIFLGPFAQYASPLLAVVDCASQERAHLVRNGSCLSDVSKPLGGSKRVFTTLINQRFSGVYGHHVATASRRYVYIHIYTLFPWRNGHHLGVVALAQLSPLFK